MSASGVISATYDDIHAVVGTVRSIRQERCRVVTVFGPIMEAELEEAIGKPPSPVRRYTFIGGAVGCISGFALTLWSSFYYPLVVGGKDLASVPAYVVIAFEMTILFAGISALIGMLIHNRMPTLELGPGHDPAYSDDAFGIRVVCDADRVDRVADVLRSYGPREVRVER